MFTATRIVQGVRRGDLSPIGVLEDCLARIERFDRDIQAWVEVDAHGSRMAAQAVAVEGARDRPLAGVPVGVKDIYDVAGLPTRAGAKPFFAYTPEQDSTAVRRLREAGAIIVGKTVTTEFAFIDPGVTRNPWDLEHTPGGSSSGSAAAVSAGMVPVALGTQTVGSILRPAAYCGIVGLKTTHGRVSLRGVVPLAPGLDHAGIFSRSVLDAALVLNALAGPDPLDPYSSQQPVQDYVQAIQALDRPPVLGLPRHYYRDIANEEVSSHIERIAVLLTTEGATVREVELPAGAHELRAMGEPVLRNQAALSHAHRFATHKDEYGPNIRYLIEMGLRQNPLAVLQAQEQRRHVRDQLIKGLGDVDAILMPVAPTTAPAGLASTGDGIFCAPASFTGLPAIALPSGLGEGGLPLSVQLMGWPFTEGRLLAVAAWVEKAIGFHGEPFAGGE